MRAFLASLRWARLLKASPCKERKDPISARPVHRWLDQLRVEYADRILPVTDAVAVEWGRMEALWPRPVVDTLIATTALVHRLNLVTRNVADFADFGVPITNPFEPGAST